MQKRASSSSHRILAPVAILMVCGVLLGCREAAGPSVSVTWSQPQPNVVVGTPVRFAGTAMGNAVSWVDIGRVVAIDPLGSGIQVTVELKKNLAHYVTATSAFILRGDDGSTNVFIEVHRLKAGEDPVVPGAVFRAAESDLDLAIQRATVDWKTTMIWALCGIVAIFVAVLIVKALFKGFAVLLCLGAGAVGAIYLKPILTPHVLPLLPQDIPLDPFVYGAGFLIAYLAAVLVISLIRLPISAVSGRRG